jgi:hypothetical protein
MKRPDLPYFPGAAGDAGNWIASAYRRGLPTGITPRVGAVAVFSQGQYGAGYYGHVAYVESVAGNKMIVSESNYKSGSITERTIEWRGLRFIYQPDEPSPAPVAPSGGSAINPPLEPGMSSPRRVIVVDNRVTSGPSMREDATPNRLTTRPWVLCGARNCYINGTERWTGGAYDAAVCQTQGDRTTNGNDSDPSDDANPERFESTRYYGVRLLDGTFGFVNEVWIRAADRGGLGLPAC